MAADVAPLVRNAEAGDFDFMATMLVEAVAWQPGIATPSVPEVLDNEQSARYLIGWPRPGDIGVIAIHGEPCGAAWCRLLPADEPGYGFVAPDVPEVTIGVHRLHRGRGIGRRLLAGLADRARSNGVERLSLSVEEGNTIAGSLYRSFGFEEVTLAAGAWTMVLIL